MTVSSRRIWMVVVVAILIAACGRRGAPKPPEENAAKPVQYLAAKADVRSVTFTWQAPVETQSGGTAKDIGSFVIRRRDVIGETTNRFEDVGVVQVDPEQKLKDQRFSFEDPSVVAGKKYDFIVFAKSSDDLEGDIDKVIRITFRGETSAIENLTPDKAGK